MNDSFANRISLGSAPAITATGDSTRATLQSGENDLDSIGGSSVWWKWTAPETAWVSVDTQGSSFDTVLAVLTDGPALRDTYIVGFNDETGEPGASAGSSRVIFLASAGVEYHMAVYGFLAVQGSIQLHIQSGISPPLRMTSLSLTPGSVNVSTAGQSITADIGIASAAGFLDGALVLHRANFSGITEIPILPGHRLSGTATDGIYRVLFDVPRYSAPGPWLVELAVADVSGQEAVFGRGVSAGFEYDHVLPDGMDGLIAVANSAAVDGTGPVLASFALSPGVVNVTSNPATTQGNFRITDDLSGFGSAVLTLYTPAGAALTVFPLTAAHRISGTALDGIYQFTLSIPAKMPGGDWSVSLLIRDAAGNPSLYDAAGNGAGFPAGPASGGLGVTGLPHGYWAWIYPLTPIMPGTQPDDDLDQDGTSNLLEYAFGMNVQESETSEALLSRGRLPSFDNAHAGFSLGYLRRTAAIAEGLIYTPQFSSGPGSWLNVSGETVAPVDNQFEKVTVTDPSPSGCRFGRIKVALAE